MSLNHFLHSTSIVVYPDGICQIDYVKFPAVGIWKGLCGLIGASDGKKFRDFAQKMTLEMMIARTNRQLIKMIHVNSIFSLDQGICLLKSIRISPEMFPLPSLFLLQL